MDGQAGGMGGGHRNPRGANSVPRSDYSTSRKSIKIELASVEIDNASAAMRSGPEVLIVDKMITTYLVLKQI